MIKKHILHMFSKSVRDKYRLNMPSDLYIEMSCDGKKRLGRLVNLSSQGACIEFRQRGEIPLVNSETTLQILFPEQQDSIYIGANVVWTREVIKDSYSQFVILGVKFKNLDADIYDSIWDFIIESISPQISQ